MANHGPAYGFSREILLKNQARFVLEEAQETLEWVASCVGVQLDPPARKMDEENIGMTMREGVILCQLMNVISSGDVVAYNRKPKMPFHMMENISQFLNAIKKYGVPEISCFQTVDLYEWKQPFKVIECLRALAAVAQKNNAPVAIPRWTVRMSKETPRRFSDDVMKAGDTVISLQMGSNRGANQSGMTPYGLGRQILNSHPSA